MNEEPRTYILSNQEVVEVRCAAAAIAALGMQPDDAIISALLAYDKLRPHFARMANTLAPLLAETTKEHLSSQLLSDDTVKFTLTPKPVRFQAP